MGDNQQCSYCHERNEVTGIYSKLNNNILVTDDHEIASKFNKFVIDVDNDLIKESQSFYIIDLHEYNDIFPSPGADKFLFSIQLLLRNYKV